MRCPKCGSVDDKVIDSRSAREGEAIRRRRECLSCGLRFTTYETVEPVELRVVKRDGRTEWLDRNKIRTSFQKACEKRPISIEMIESAVQEIIHSFDDADTKEVTSQQIGSCVMAKLHEMDPVAYVRYASVYREFQEIGDFLEEIQTMEKRKLQPMHHPELFEPSVVSPK